MKYEELNRLKARIISCHKCPRLVAWREKVAREKTARFHGETYWGKPVPGFGNNKPRVLIVGLAPAAHGANRTGRMFTGDRSGEWLFRRLHKFGFSNRPNSLNADDDLVLKNCYITAIIRCAPPGNKPLNEEIQNCRKYLLDEMQIFRSIKVIVALGKIAFDQTLDLIDETGIRRFSKRPKFVHGAIHEITDSLTLISSYHPSQQNTFTGRLTPKMFDSVFRSVKDLIGRF